MFILFVFDLLELVAQEAFVHVGRDVHLDGVVSSSDSVDVVGQSVEITGILHVVDDQDEDEGKQHHSHHTDSEFLVLRILFSFIHFTSVLHENLGVGLET